MVESEHKIKDDIGIDSIIGAENSMAKECEMFERQLKALPDTIANYKEQWDIEEKMWNIKLDNFRPVDSQVKMKFELNEEFWECLEAIERYKFRQVKHQAEQQLEMYDKQKEEAYNQLETMYAEIEKMENE